MASDTDALQRVYRLANIVERDVDREIGSSNSRRYNEMDSSAFEFFIEFDCANDFVPWEILWQTRRQLKSSQKVDHRIALSGRESAPFN